MSVPWGKHEMSDDLPEVIRETNEFVKLCLVEGSDDTSPEGIPLYLAPKMPTVDSIMVPLAVLSILSVGRAIGKRTILYMVECDRMVVSMVVMLRSLTLKAGPEQKHSEMSSWSTSVMQVKIITVLMELYPTGRNHGSLLL